MEAAAIARHAIEFGRSNPFRRVLELFQAVKSHFSRADDAARWKDVFWEERRAMQAAPRAKAVARTSMSLQQAELWTESAAEADVGLRQTARHLERSVPMPSLTHAPMVSMSEIYARSAAKAHQAALARRNVMGAPVHRAPRRQVQMSRMLEANRIVDGISAPSRVVTLPGFLSGAHFNLWKGRKVGTPFLMGQ